MQFPLFAALWQMRRAGDPAAAEYVKKIKTVLLCLALASSSASSRAADTAPCPEDSNVDQVKCLARQIESANADLDLALQSAQRAIPQSDPTDSRKGWAQLAKAQDAWRKYVTEQCTFEGGVEGGSNLWVTHFAMDCELAEIRRRIAYLRGVHVGG